MQKYRELHITLVVLILSIVALGIVRADFNGPSANPPTGDGVVVTNGSGYAGVGTTPSVKLHVEGDSTSNGGWVEGSLFLENSAGATGEVVTAYQNYDTGSNYWFTGINDSQSGRFDIMYGTGVTAANALLTIETDGDTTIGGTGKLNVNTIDPIYTIDGERYATYVANILGVKEEVTGLIYVNGEVTIDFRDQEQGSDLWLFAKITDLEKNFDKMVVLLTPSFGRNVWYEKDFGSLRLTIHAEGSGEVSYRFTAPRFDWKSWPNVLGPGSHPGLIINTTQGGIMLPAQ